MEKTSWDLSLLYKTREDFLKEVSSLKEEMKKFASYKGKLGDMKELHSFLALLRDYGPRLLTVNSYASQKNDLDQRVIESQQDAASVENLFADFSSAVSFVNPELLSLGEDYFKDYFAKHPEDKDYDFEIEKLFANKEHVLSGEKEQLLSYFSQLENTGAGMYGALSVADDKGKEITLSDGKKVKVTQSSWVMLEETLSNPDDRKAVFEALYSHFEEHKNTYGKIYTAVVNAELAEMKARGYSSILEEHLAQNRIPTSVFETLIKVASENSAPLKKYVQLRKKYLHLKEYHTYERFLKFAHSDKKYTYEEAKEFFYGSIEHYTPDYQKKAREVTKEGYVDVYEHEGKISGAYSTGWNSVHPFILLNFQGTLDDVFTLAHESGHSVHTLYASESQPLFKQDYTIFVAEIASTFNEHNLLDYMMDKGTLSLDEKIMLLQKAIDEISSTFYRQTVFAHFEYNIAKKAERGEPLNYDVFNKEMISLYKQYYGLDITKEKLKCYVWAYIPHLFYTPFYVYQYATSFTASMEFYNRFKKGGIKDFEKYISLLKMGGSDFPVEEVKKAGVDLTKEETYLSVTNRMSELVDELEKLLEEKEKESK